MGEEWGRRKGGGESAMLGRRGTHSSASTCASTQLGLHGLDVPSPLSFLLSFYFLQVRAKLSPLNSSSRRRGRSSSSSIIISGGHYFNLSSIFSQPEFMDKPRAGISIHANECNSERERESQSPAHPARARGSNISSRVAGSL